MDTDAIGTRARGLALALTLCLALTPGARGEEVSAGRAQFIKSCGVCHVADPAGGPRQGPNLFGVVGRHAASVDGFKYSDALKGADWVWDEARLDHWIEDAQAVRPGTTMSYRQADPERRALIVGYLKSLGR